MSLRPDELTHGLFNKEHIINLETISVNLNDIPIADWGFQRLNFPMYNLSLQPLLNRLMVFCVPGSVLPAQTHLSVAPQCLCEHLQYDPLENRSHDILYHVTQ